MDDDDVVYVDGKKYFIVEDPDDFVETEFDNYGNELGHYVTGIVKDEDGVEYTCYWLINDENMEKYEWDATAWVDDWSIADHVYEN